MSLTSAFWNYLPPTDIFISFQSSRKGYWTVYVDIMSGTKSARVPAPHWSPTWNIESSCRSHTWWGLTSGERSWESSWGSGAVTPPQGVVEGPWPKKTKIGRAQSPQSVRELSHEKLNMFIKKIPSKAFLTRGGPYGGVLGSCNSKKLSPCAEPLMPLPKRRKRTLQMKKRISQIPCSRNELRWPAYQWSCKSTRGKQWHLKHKSEENVVKAFAPTTVAI